MFPTRTTLLLEACAEPSYHQLTHSVISTKGSSMIAFTNSTPTGRARSSWTDIRKRHGLGLGCSQRLDQRVSSSPRFVLLILILGLISMTGAYAASDWHNRVPPPGCYDYHGCGVFEMPWHEYEALWMSHGFPSPPDAFGYQGATYGGTTFTSLDEIWVIANLLAEHEIDVDWCDLEFSSCAIGLAGIIISSCGGDYACLRINELNPGAGIALPGGQCEDR